MQHVDRLGACKSPAATGLRAAIKVPFTVSSSDCCVHSLSMRCCRVGFCGWPSPPKLESGPDAGASPAEAVKWPPESACSYGDHSTTRDHPVPGRIATTEQCGASRASQAALHTCHIKPGGWDQRMGPLTEPPAENVRALLCTQLLKRRSGHDEIAPLCWISKAVAGDHVRRFHLRLDHRLASKGSQQITLIRATHRLDTLL